MNNGNGNDGNIAFRGGNGWDDLTIDDAEISNYIDSIQNGGEGALALDEEEEEEEAQMMPGSPYQVQRGEDQDVDDTDDGDEQFVPGHHEQLHSPYHHDHDNDVDDEDVEEEEEIVYREFADPEEYAQYYRNEEDNEEVSEAESEEGEEHDRQEQRQQQQLEDEEMEADRVIFVRDDSDDDNGGDGNGNNGNGGGAGAAGGEEYQPPVRRRRIDLESDSSSSSSTTDSIINFRAGERDRVRPGRSNLASSPPPSTTIDWTTTEEQRQMREYLTTPFTRFRRQDRVPLALMDPPQPLVVTATAGPSTTSATNDNNTAMMEDSNLRAEHSYFSNSSSPSVDFSDSPSINTGREAEDGGSDVNPELIGLGDEDDDWSVVSETTGSEPTTSGSGSRHAHDGGDGGGGRSHSPVISNWRVLSHLRRRNAIVLDHSDDSNSSNSNSNDADAATSSTRSSNAVVTNGGRPRGEVEAGRVERNPTPAVVNNNDNADIEVVYENIGHETIGRIVEIVTTRALADEAETAPGPAPGANSAGDGEANVVTIEGNLVHVETMSIASTSTASTTNPRPNTTDAAMNTSLLQPNSNNNSYTKDDDEGLTCLICYEPYTNSGEHRLACLRCGHTYGKECIEKWIKNEARCPQCNSKASKKDVRIIYVKNLKALDTAERDAAIAKLEKEREAKRRLELECAKLRQKLQVKDSEYVEMSLKYNHMKNRIGGLYRTTSKPDGLDNDVVELPGPSSSSNNKYGNRSASGSGQQLHYNQIKSFVLQGDCRVGVYNQWLNMLAVSQSVKSPLYPNGLHSIRRLNLLDMTLYNSTPLHTKEIRDLAFCTSQSDTLLSVGMDKKVVLSNTSSNVIIQSMSTETPLWSCAWNELNQYSFYAGGSNGSIFGYDLRKPNELLINMCLPTGVDKSPIVRLIYVGPSYASAVTANPSSGSGARRFNMTGLLIQKLNSIWFWEMRNGGMGHNQGQEIGQGSGVIGGGHDDRFHQLPLEGPFLSISFEPTTRHLLVSTRPRGGETEGKHLVCSLGVVYCDATASNVVACDVVHSYTNPMNFSRMTRSCIYSVNHGSVGGSGGSAGLGHGAGAGAAKDKIFIAANGGSITNPISKSIINKISIWSISESNWKQTLNIGPEPVLDFIPCKLNSSHLLGTLTSSNLYMYNAVVQEWQH